MILGIVLKQYNPSGRRSNIKTFEREDEKFQPFLFTLQYGHDSYDINWRIITFRPSGVSVMHDHV